MRFAVLMLMLCSVVACKKKPQMTLPDMPDANERGSQTLVDTHNGGRVINRLWHYSGHAGQAMAFYKPFVEKMGAHKVGPDTWVDDNLVHTGSFGREGNAMPKDDTKPGVFIEVLEGNNETLVDVWESVPKAP
jgi:hypothetical protein